MVYDSINEQKKKKGHQKFLGESLGKGAKLNRGPSIRRGTQNFEEGPLNFKRGP